MATGQFLVRTAFLSVDLKVDCAVHLTDLATLLARFGTQSGASAGDGDLDGDGDVDLTDVPYILPIFGTSCI